MSVVKIKKNGMWIPLHNAQGPKGDKGDVGATGPAGAKGPKGDVGPIAIAVQNEAPTDSNIKIWVDTSTGNIKYATEQFVNNKIQEILEKKELWTFTMSDGSTVQKEVIIS